jgi:hypothetical protein
VKLDRRLGRVEREAARSNEIPAAIAVDFLRGGAPSTAEAYDRKGAFLAAFARDEGETVLTGGLLRPRGLCRAFKCWIMTERKHDDRSDDGAAREKNEASEIGSRPIA